MKHTRVLARSRMRLQMKFHYYGGAEAQARGSKYRLKGGPNNLYRYMFKRHVQKCSEKNNRGQWK